jgi:hypothetical protein
MSNDSGKVVINFGWKEMVFSLEDGIEILKIFDRAERYTERYISATKSTSYHAFKDEDETITAKVITNEKYNIAKLAGKPQD